MKELLFGILQNISVLKEKKTFFFSFKTVHEKKNCSPKIEP